MTIAAGNRHELRRLIEERLKDSRPPTDARSAVPAGFSAEVAAAVRQYFPAAPVAAAVLVPIVDRDSGLTVLLTQRASHLKNHAGQISFPGGRIEDKDEGPLAAALRETEEEIGLSRENVNRQLSQLKHANVLRNAGTHILVTDEAALCEIAETTWMEQ